MQLRGEKQACLLIQIKELVQHRKPRRPLQINVCLGDRRQHLRTGADYS